MDIEYHTYHTEYILPCTVNIPSEDDIVIDFVTNVSMVYSFIYLCEMQPIIFNLTILESDISLLGLFVFGRKVRCYGTRLED
jgi:hypothetical protein